MTDHCRVGIAMTPSKECADVLSDDILLEEAGCDMQLFHCRCIVKDWAVGFSIDDKTTVNVAGMKLIKDLKLETMPHPRPYRTLWYDCILDITTQVRVQFSMGSYSSEVLCDVILVPLISCQLLLGKPWCEEYAVT